MLWYNEHLLVRNYNQVRTQNFLLAGRGADTEEIYTLFYELYYKNQIVSIIVP